MKKFCLIGNPVSHSFSPSFFNTKFEREGLPYVYEAYKLEDAAQLPSLLSEKPEIMGLNVTSPFKRDVIPYMDSLTPLAEKAGAVNTIRVTRDTEGKVVRLDGHNTDVEGFMEMLAPCRDYLEGSEALVLGTGGASSAVRIGCEEMGIRPIMVSRHPQEHQCLSYSDLDEQLFKKCRLIVNATPLGMGSHQDEKPSIPYEYLGSQHLVVDLIYNPPLTPFLLSSLSRSTLIRNGLAMLHSQALASLRFFLMPSTGIIS